MEKEYGYIKVNDVNLYYQFLNKHLLAEGKPLLVFLHEGLGSIAQWKDFPELLCEHVNLPGFIYDREGHGKSDALREKRGKNFMHIQAQQAIPALFNRLEIEHHNKIIIGHSDGGSIAIIHAGSFPANISGIVTMAAHLFLEDISLEGIREAVKIFEEGKMRELLYKYHGDKTDNMFYGWAHTWLNPTFRDWNIEEYLPKIKAPYLGLQGDNDQYGSPAQLESIKKHTENSRIELIPNCGHIPHLQQRERVMEIFSEFIGKIK